jgi:Rieske Fe-S protein
MKLTDSYLSRRRFLGSMVGGGATALGLGTLVPLTRYVGDLRAKPLPDYVELDRAEYDPEPGASRMLMYGRIPALIVRTPEDELKVFVAICTHFDCTVGYLAEENRIFCACHEGRYDVDGRVVSGPPPEPLRQFHHRLEGNRLVIALEAEDLDKAFEEARS